MKVYIPGFTGKQMMSHCDVTINALQWSAYIEKTMRNNCFENIKFYFVVFQN